MDWVFMHIMLLQPVVWVHVGSSRQASGRGDNDESLGTKQLSSITHPLVSVLGEILSAAIWLVIRLESGCESAPCENRASLVAANFFYWHAIYEHGWLHFVDVARRCWTIYLAEKLFCFLNGAVTKNRTLTKPSCQVRRLSKLKSACLIYLHSFVCSVARRVLSFEEACLCYAHGCTFLAVFLLPSPKTIGMAF